MINAANSIQISLQEEIIDAYKPDTQTKAATASTNYSHVMYNFEPESSTKAA